MQICQKLNNPLTHIFYTQHTFSTTVESVSVCVCPFLYCSFYACSSFDALPFFLLFCFAVNQGRYVYSTFFVSLYATWLHCCLSVCRYVFYCCCCSCCQQEVSFVYNTLWLSLWAFFVICHKYVHTVHTHIYTYSAVSMFFCYLQLRFAFFITCCCPPKNRERETAQSAR